MCLAAGKQILFYSSPNLLEWQQTGSFGDGYGSTDGVWETPDLFQLPVDERSDTRWVLTVGVGSGFKSGGSGTQYFIGNFEGGMFTSEYPKDTILWMDHGADFYAPQSWNDEPNGRRLMIAWMNNWQYALHVPSAGQRGMLSLIRQMSLRRTENGIRLVNNPIPEIQQLRGTNHHWQDQVIRRGTNLLGSVRGQILEIIAEFKLIDSISCFGFRVLAGEHEHTTICYDVKKEEICVDRTHSGSVDFKEGFARIETAPLSPTGRIVRLRIFVDRCSAEVFVNDGLITFTESVFPSEDSDRLELFAEGGKVLLDSLDIYELRPPSFEAVKKE
jgi:fructan beta-fructosidase